MSHRKPTEPDEPTQETKPRPRKKGKKMPEAFDIPVPSYRHTVLVQRGLALSGFIG